MTDRALTFFRRLASSVTLWGLALWIIFSGFVPGFVVLVSGLSLLALWEYYGMLDHKKLPHFKVFGMLCGALFCAGSFYYFGRTSSSGVEAPFALRTYDFEVATLLLFMLVVFTRQMFQKTRDISPLETMAYTIFGLLYIPWMFSFITKIIFLPPHDLLSGNPTGQWYVLWLVVVTKFSDMGAYVTGSLIGRHPLVPHISPKKTWEGFFGALAFSVGGACGLLAIMPHRLPLLSQADAVILGLVLGFAAIVGDLAESILKRNCEVKDSGHMLPGIGGTLDLIDSLLFTAPLLFFYLRFAKLVQ